jgi:hypothetical protein
MLQEQESDPAGIAVGVFFYPIRGFRPVLAPAFLCNHWVYLSDSGL